MDSERLLRQPVAPERVLHVLHLEDDAEEAAFVRKTLAQSRHAIEISTFKDVEGFEAALASGSWDLILVDCGLDSCSGHTALEALAGFPHGAPLVLLSDHASALDGAGLPSAWPCPIGKRELPGLLPMIDRLLDETVQRRELGDQVSALARQLDERASRAEEALAASEQFYRATLDALNKHVGILDEAGVVLATNRAWREFGQESGVRRPAVGENYFATCRIGDRYGEQALQGIREVQRQRRDIFNLEYPWQAGEQVLWFQMTVTRFEGPGMIRLVIIHDDITERLVAEEAIKTLTGQTRSLLDNMSDLAYMKDAECRYVAINQPAMAFCKKSFEQIIGKTDFDLFPEDIARRFRQVDEMVLKSGRRTSMEEELQLADGSKVWLETVKTPIRDPDGQIIGLTGISREITQRKEAESILVASHDHLERLVSERTAELEKANRTLKETERLRRNFVSSLTHDLRTPLIAQKRLIELLQDAGEEQREFLMNGLEKNNENLLDMVNKLLETYQYVEGRIVLELEEFNLAELVRECVAEMKEIADKKQLKLVNAIDTDSFPVMADRGLLKRVIINLVSNAIENIPEYCEITLNAQRGEDRWSLCVSDNGMGISPELLPNLFDRYFPRGGGQRQRIGSGLGLFICKMIVELHEGEIKVESEVGQGATFCIAFPARPDAVVSAPEDEPDHG